MSGQGDPRIRVNHHEIPDVARVEETNLAKMKLLEENAGRKEMLGVLKSLHLLTEPSPDFIDEERNDDLESANGTQVS